MRNPVAKTALKVAHRNDRVQIKQALTGSGQPLLPMLDLLEGAQASIDEWLHETAAALVEQLLVLALVRSAQELAGAKPRGRDGGTVLWPGAQRGVVALAERQLRVQRPRLRDKNGCEVALPAGDRLRDDTNFGARVRGILVAGVSTRRDAAVRPEVAGMLGLSKRTVSRRLIEGSAAQLAALNARSLAELTVRLIYIDGIVASGHHLIAAVGVDEAGDKPLLGLALGASEYALVVKVLAAHADALPVHDQAHREPQRHRAAHEPAGHALLETPTWRCADRQPAASKPGNRSENPGHQGPLDPQA